MGPPQKPRPPVGIDTRLQTHPSVAHRWWLIGRLNGRATVPRLSPMPRGIVTHALGRAAEHVPGLRWIPVFKLLSAAEIALLARDHVGRLTPGERRRLVALVRIGRGRRSRLTPEESAELEQLLVRLAPRELLGDTVDRLSPVPLPRRLLYGRAQKP
jgi:hypothetical protein